MAISKETIDKWNRYVNACDEDEFRHKMNDWENEFIDSILEDLHYDKILTLKQAQKLGQIYHKVVE
jgi:hypothetical protein